jgi:hypothetical protein
VANSTSTGHKMPLRTTGWMSQYSSCPLRPE